MGEIFNVLHTADWHICDEFMRDAQACTDFIIAEAIRIQPHLIMISGDIYNHRQIRQESKAARLAFATIRRLAQVAPVAVLVGTPSHDGRAPEILGEINETYPVWVEGLPNMIIMAASPLGEIRFCIDPDQTFKDEDWSPVAIISFVPALTKQFFRSDSDIATSDQEIAKELAGIFAGFGAAAHDINRQFRYKNQSGPLPHVLAGHWQVGGAFIHPSQALTGLDIEIARDHIELAKADVVCLGHIHAQQKIGQNIFYPGSIFATDFGEIEAKGFYSHVLECVDMGDHWELKDSEFIHTPSPRLIKINSDLLNAKNEDTLNIAILAALKGLSADEKAIIRMEVKIYQDMAHTVDQDLIKRTVTEKLNPRKFDLNINRMPRPNVRSARIMKADDLSEKLAIRASTIGDEITKSIEEKSMMLQFMESEEILTRVQREVQI